MNRRRIDHDEVRSLRERKMPYEAIAAQVGCCESYVRLIVNRKVGDGPTTHSRMASSSLAGKTARPMPPIDNRSIASSRTLYPSTVKDPIGQLVLKSGFNSAKIGRAIVKGKWRGFPVYTLTLEERATCPSTCSNWRSCYGNAMHQTLRYAHGPSLEASLIEEVTCLAGHHPGGFAVRLHTLGDFYSERYVELWSMLLDQVPQLHAFGFSARWHYHEDPVARALIDLVLRKWDRFAIRFSDAPIDECSTISIEHPIQKPADAIICPQQLGKTTACSTCALCWQSKRRIAFVKH